MKTNTTLAVFTIVLSTSGLSLETAHPAPFDIETKITADDADVVDTFGVSVAIDGSTALIGAIGDDDGGSNSGSAYLFDAATGNQLDKLTAEDAGANDQFGISVAISGNTALVGARSDSDDGRDSGSAYLFDITTGLQLAKLTADDAAAQDEFGFAVAISGNTALVGAYLDDDGGSTSGSAYLFDVTTGRQFAKLTATDAAADDQFGKSVAISGNTALVGARLDDDGGNDSGSAYLFDISTGLQLAKLTADDAEAGDQFGISVAISGNIALVGARSDDDGGSDSGSAYLFDITTGSQLAKLTAADAESGDWFGRSVAISGNTALVGASANDYAGAAYLFDINTGLQLAMLTADDAEFGDDFGISVAISGNTALVGAAFEGDVGTFFGSAYLYKNTIPEPSSLLFSTLGGACLLARRRKR